MSARLGTDLLIDQSESATQMVTSALKNRCFGIQGTALGRMLSESFIGATLSANKVNSHLSSNLKDVGIFQHEIQPRAAFRYGYKKSSIDRNCLAISEHHIFAAQADKAVINAYSTEKGNQEATVPFPERIHSLAYVAGTGILVIGTEGGRLMLWETATGRVTTSSASHLQPITSLCITANLGFILSASSDSAVHVWSLQGLISVSQPSNSYEHTNTKSPVRTFSGHRNAVTALACSHSKGHTSFAVSCSQDQTCYLWSVQDCQILRTYLLPSTPLCFSIDVADRGIFTGYEDGSVQLIDLYGRSTQQSDNSVYNSTSQSAIQLTDSECWPPSATAADPTYCMTLSFDGTVLLSGHKSGKVVGWDVAKGRVRNQIVELAQPVTNIEMLRPVGLPTIEPLDFQIMSVVKPRLDLNAYNGVGMSGLPLGYEFQAKIAASNRNFRHSAAFHELLNCTVFPEDVTDEALYEMRAGNTSIPQPKLDELQKEVAELSSHLDILRDAIGKSRDRRLKRVEKREKFAKEKMTRKELDQESDEEELAQEIYGDLR